MKCSWRSRYLCPLLNYFRRNSNQAGNLKYTNLIISLKWSNCYESGNFFISKNAVKEQHNVQCSLQDIKRVFWFCFFFNLKYSEHSWICIVLWGSSHLPPHCSKHTCLYTPPWEGAHVLFLNSQHLAGPLAFTWQPSQTCLLEEWIQSALALLE